MGPVKLRKHRILFNGDSNFLFAQDYRQPPSTKPYTAQVLDDYVALLARSGVDTFLYNPNGQVPWYPSKVLPSILAGMTRSDKSIARLHYPPLAEDFTQKQLDACLAAQAAMLDRFFDLMEAGVDLLAHTAAACRKCGISPWVSIRMNDAHGGNSWEGSYFNSLPQRDKRFRLSGRRMDPAGGVNPYAALCNYEHREVRDYYFTMIRELVEDYDLDGLELDWLRITACCEPPATKEARETMLEWLVSIRELTQRNSARRGRPFFLGLRIPSRLNTLRTIGLDVPEMARRGLLDFINPSNYWQTTWDIPYDQLREQVGSEVAIYGVIEDAPNWMFARAGASGEPSFRKLSASAELIRGNAAGKLAMGADGIEFFNFFCTDSLEHDNPACRRMAQYPAIKRINELEFLRGQPKHYALATAFNLWSSQFFERADQLPAFIEPGGWKSFALSMCAEPPQAGLELQAQVVVERDGEGASSPTARLGLSLNGSWPTFEGRATDRLLLPTGVYTHHVPEYAAWNYRLNPADIQDGWNEITIYHSQEDYYPWPVTHAKPIKIVSVELAVLPK
jgi:hypothetical protein